MNTRKGQYSTHVYNEYGEKLYMYAYMYTVHVLKLYSSNIQLYTLQLVHVDTHKQLNCIDKVLGDRLEYQVLLFYRHIKDLVVDLHIAPLVSRELAKWDLHTILCYLNVTVPKGHLVGHPLSLLQPQLSLWLEKLPVVIHNLLLVSQVGQIIWPTKWYDTL